MRICYLLLFSLLLPCLMSAQPDDDDDLLEMLGEEETIDYATASFKTNRVINGHSLENTAHGVLDFKISHRFGMVNTGFSELFGLDNAMTRIGLDYGITDNLTIGFGRNSFVKIYDGFVKYKFLRQSKGKRKMPLTVAALADIAIITKRKSEVLDPENNFSSRLAYTYQVILGRKFNDYFTLQLMPTLVHRNLVQFDEQNDVFALGVGSRVKLSKRMAITLEYYYTPKEQLPDDEFRKYYSSLSVGIDIETGGHVFQLHFTNSTSMAHRGYITETTGNWLEGDIHFGFNVSRVFTIVKPKEMRKKNQDLE